MSLLIAFAGFSGAGKTTAVDHFVESGLGGSVYLGKYVLKEVESRGLPSIRENERKVRLELRAQHGPGVLVQRALPDIGALLDRGDNVFLDAVFEPEEFSLLASHWGSSAHLVGITASFETRSARLRVRDDRPYSSAELADRDKTEATQLKTQSVLDSAAHRINNEGTIEEFRSDLRALWKRLS